MEIDAAVERWNVEQDIKSMKLYSQVDRIYNELKELGLDRESKLDVDTVSKFDQYHYYGTAAIDHAIKCLPIEEGHTVLDMGSGLGGPARYLAAKRHCHVMAVELQEDLHQIGLDLTRRCGLADNVQHVHGNLLDDDIGCPPADVLVSWLVFLHIAQKKRMFESCRKALKTSGKMYIEDMFVSGQPTSEKGAKILQTWNYSLNTKEEYVKYLQNAGFVDIDFQDQTTEWGLFVRERDEQYRVRKERHVRVHSERVYAEQEDFYDKINYLFSSGDVRGCIIIATAGE